MFGRIITSLIVWVMNNTRFSIENRTKCITALLNKLNFIPHKDIIEIDGQGRTVINGRLLDLDKARQLRESAKAMLANQCRNLVREQVAFKAVSLGVHNGTTPEQLFWCRTALWIYQQENELYHALAQE